jgi:predicted lipoprotein with Yx(FWY)xxD motif
MRRAALPLACLGAFTLALSIAPPAMAQSGAPLSPPKPDTVTLQITQSDTMGSYITDAKGHAVYVFTKDGKGESRCSDACAEAWPPVVTSGKPRGGSKIDAKKIGVTERADGKRQVTYDGRPLYYYKQDGETMAISGQAVFSYDGDWYLIAPSGALIKEKRKGENPPAPK